MASQVRKKRKRNNDDYFQASCEYCLRKDEYIAELKQDIECLQKKVDRRDDLLKKEKKSKDDALIRLSALISSRIRDNNPDVCDLSDPNRPTKIAEQMSELYDNEWTDAFEELEQSINKLDNDEELEQGSKQMKSDVQNEHLIINTLLETLMTIYKECMDIAANWYQTVKKTIKYPKKISNAEESSLSEDIWLPKEMLVEIKQFRKKDAMVTLPTIRKMLLERIPWYSARESSGPAMRKYIAECESLCWLAALQDPPLHLDAEVPIEFTRRLYKEYTHEGPHVQFIVWPIVRITKNGGILNKGIAQGCTFDQTELDICKTERKMRVVSME